ncbi:unnamed protein product [Clonostachys rosea]|uniref:Uncharacterized protein n=1 Tax=Bionectria ochroleuca TaxID=29856 RepID=A0ABY6U828_BIOOC|nr:unnamed protein product [Clonostachys rosea]
MAGKTSTCPRSLVLRRQILALYQFSVSAPSLSVEQPALLMPTVAPGEKSAAAAIHKPSCPEGTVLTGPNDLKKEWTQDTEP